MLRKQRENTENGNAQITIEQIKEKNRKKYKKDRIIRGTIFALLWIMIATFSYIAYYLADKKDALDSTSNNVTTSVNENASYIDE